MSLFLDDGDIRLYHGDALETVRELPDESVDCVVTSPPYWGLRDYGTGEWDGGDPACDHTQTTARKDGGRSGVDGFNGSRAADSDKGAIQYRETCGKCGARRVDRQMGLEPTPDLFVAGMVELFREIRRVLAPHGTCWVNLGDSYNSAASNQRNELIGGWNAGMGRSSTLAPDLKPKDLVGIPWRVAFALQADGWYLRSDIIWAKPNPMPESVTDRPTKSHEYVFLLTKQPRYWFDAEAVREPHSPDNRTVTTVQGGNGSIQHRDGERWPGTGRNVRSVWQIATQPYPEAHFATYPEELARRCILAGCPVRVCRVCGKPSERIVERELVATRGNINPANKMDGGSFVATSAEYSGGVYGRYDVTTTGWSDCGCAEGTPVNEGSANGGGGSLSASKWRPGVVLDPFIGSGTTAKVARDHQRHAIGIDLNETYLDLAARRLQQLSLLT